MKMNVLTMMFVVLFCLPGCQQSDLEFEVNDYKLEVIPGDSYLHAFRLPLGLKKKNPPQMVIWAEDTAGNYLTTLYCTYRAATASWRKSPGEDIPSGGIRRESALPYWAHKWRLAQQIPSNETDAFTGASAKTPVMPDKNQPLVDGITGATQIGATTLKLTPAWPSQVYCILVEVNQSTDFNEAFPKNAQPGDVNYSGGELGSGQPALVYRILINPNLPQLNNTFELIGHSSADGSTADLYTDLSGITSALNIIEEIKLTKW